MSSDHEFGAVDSDDSLVTFSADRLVASVTSASRRQLVRLWSAYSVDENPRFAVKCVVARPFIDTWIGISNRALNRSWAITSGGELDSQYHELQPLKLLDLSALRGDTAEWTTAVEFDPGRNRLQFCVNGITSEWIDCPDVVNPAEWHPYVELYVYFSDDRFRCDRFRCVCTF